MSVYQLHRYHVWLLLVMTCGCVQKAKDAEQVGTEQQTPVSGHERMRQELHRISERSNGFVGDQHAQKLRQFRNEPQFRKSLAPAKEWELMYESGVAELKLGHEDEAISLLKQSLELVPAGENSLLKQTHFQLGVASLRYGETQNCCLLNSSESCIVPIRGSGIHTRPEGSRKAIKHFTFVLENPADAANEEEVLALDKASRWLLNIAYMTLGEYPENVPEEYLVPPETFQPESDFPRFVNIYPQLGLNTFNLCGGAVVDDLDGDHDLDVMTCTWDVSGQTQVFRNNGDGSFDEVTESSSLQGFYGGLNLNQADFDNDGDLDIFIMRGAWLAKNGQHPNSLLRNDGELKFTDVTFELGLGDFLPTKTSAWADYDNDGDLDLYVGNETSEELQAPCQLFRQNEDGTFTDVAQEAGIKDYVFSMGAAWGDYNNDRYPDLYLSIVGENILYRNNQDGTFTNVAAEAKVVDPDNSFPTWFWDFNNDGLLDIYVGCTSGTVGVLASDIRFEMMHLYKNNGDGTFDDVAEEMGLHYPAQPMGANFGDLNNDGYSDFYLATGNVQYSEICPNVMFLNHQGKTFSNVTMAGGFGHLQKGHGVSFADIDNDGDQDVYVQLGGAYIGDQFSDCLFENPGFENQSVTLKLVGTTSNRSAIGARVKLFVKEDGVERVIHHHVTSGSSFGANPLKQTIGVGQATVIEKMEIYWPTSETSQIFENVPARNSYLVKEGVDSLQQLKIRKFQFPD